MGKSLEDLAREQSIIREKPDRTIRLRVRGRVINKGAAWAEVALQIKLHADGRWEDLTHEDRPLLIARQYSGEREAPELYVVSALKQWLSAHGASVSLHSSEQHLFHGGTSWHYWAYLGGPVSVAVETQSDGTVRVLGLK